MCKVRLVYEVVKRSLYFVYENFQGQEKVETEINSNSKSRYYNVVWPVVQLSVFSSLCPVVSYKLKIVIYLMSQYYIPRCQFYVFLPRSPVAFLFV